MADEWSYESSLTWAGTLIRPGDTYPVFLSTTHFYQADSPLITGNTLAATLERIGIPLIAPGVSQSSYKLVNGVWPVVSGTLGDILNFYFGMQEDSADDSVSWEGPFPFIIGESDYLDPLISGRFFAIRIEGITSEPWTLIAYNIDFSVIGEH